MRFSVELRFSLTDNEKMAILKQKEQVCWYVASPKMMLRLLCRRFKMFQKLFQKTYDVLYH